MSALDFYQTRFEKDAWRIFCRVLDRVRRANRSVVTDNDLLVELLNSEHELFTAIFEQLSVDFEGFRREIEKRIIAEMPKPTGELKLDEELIQLFETGWTRATVNARDRITTCDLLAGLAQRSESSLARVMLVFGVDMKRVATAILTCIEQRERDNSSNEAAAEMPFRKGETVRIKSGPFLAFSGRVRHVNLTDSTVTVTLNGLESIQLVELPFTEVQKLVFS